MSAVSLGACASFAALKVPTIRQTTSMTTRSSRGIEEQFSCSVSAAVLSPFAFAYFKLKPSPDYPGRRFSFYPPLSKSKINNILNNVQSILCIRINNYGVFMCTATPVIASGNSNEGDRCTSSSSKYNYSKCLTTDSSYTVFCEGLSVLKEV